ncbi:MAG: hypothetical protein COC15_01300 [Legionellales bacterium]|nr:MAG: hypothetical protein COC15_01300 [Legionellales bacterium]
MKEEDIATTLLDEATGVVTDWLIANGFKDPQDKKQLRAQVRQELINKAANNGGGSPVAEHPHMPNHGGMPVDDITPEALDKFSKDVVSVAQVLANKNDLKHKMTPGFTEKLEQELRKRFTPKVELRRGRRFAPPTFTR